jgi:hypothetical protein
MDNESVNKDESVEELFNDEEFKKALETVESSKSVSKKEGKIESSESFLNKFKLKMKKDPVIGICLAAIVLCIVGAVLYFVLPAYYVKSFDMTVDEFREKYTQTSLYSQGLDQFNFAIPPVEYVEKEPESTGIALTADPSLSNPNANSNNEPESHERYFSAAINTSATQLATGIEGRCRSVDNKVTAVRVLVQYEPSEEFYTFLRVFYATYLQTFNPELTDNEAVTLAADMLYVVDNGEYMRVGDIAFRSYTCTEFGVTCIAMEIVPVEAVS